MLPLYIRVLAQEDIQLIVDYYEIEAAHIVDKFLESLYVELDVIKDDPGLFQIKYRLTRVRYVRGFPYGIHYIIRQEAIEVLAVLHTSRNPNVAQKR